MSEIRATIRKFIVDELHSGVETDDLDDTTFLIEEELIDSLGIMATVSFIEAHWHVEVDAEDVLLENFETIPAIERLVERKLR
jgi:acyl carrier protein